MMSFQSQHEKLVKCCWNFSFLEYEPIEIIQQAVSSLSWLQGILLLTQASSNEVALEDDSVGIQQFVSVFRWIEPL